MDGAGPARRRFMIQDTSGFAMPAMSRRILHAGLYVVMTAVISGCAATNGEDTRDPVELHREALNARERGEDTAALEAYRALLELEPERPQAWFERGKLAASADRLDEAQKAFENALEHDPEFAKARHNLGLVHMRKGAEMLQAARENMGDTQATRSTDVYLSCLLAQTVEHGGLDIPCPDLP